MKTQNQNFQWGWIFGLTMLVLLGTDALAASRSDRRGQNRSLSESASQPVQVQQSSPPARVEQRSASGSVSRTNRREATPTVSQNISPQVEVRSPSQSTRSSRVASSQPRPRTVERSRSVEHEVIIAPSSRSLNVSPSQSGAKTLPSSDRERVSVSNESVTTTISSSATQVQTNQASPVSVNTAEKSTNRERVRRDRVVEVKGVQSEKSDNSASPTIRPLRKSRTIETVGIAQQENVSKESITTTISSNTVDVQVKETIPASVSSTGRRTKQERPNSSKAAQELTARSDKSDDSSSPTVGPIPQERSGEPIRIKTDDIKIQPRRSRLSDGQQPDNTKQTIRPRSKERDKTITVLAATTDDTGKLQRTLDLDSSRRQSDSRWAGLRSKISARADVNAAVNREGIRSREDRRQRDGLAQRDEQRGRVVVGRDNNIVMERGRSDQRPRPHISNHLISDIQHIRDDNRWVSHNSCFISRWSDYSCGRVILTPYHHWYGISYYYPSYHRKYLFVSLGGYWPYSYRYQRYYWYGCHPYYWYGAYVVSQPATVVYDYTAYNYYNSAPAVTTEAAVITDFSEDSNATDTPLPQTESDICFANAVNAFEAGRYDEAAGLFREAIRLSPEDDLLPFTYSQALFAGGNYAMAANVLREAMARVPADEPAVYYPRGLYQDDQVLKNQIIGLENTIIAEPFSTDYQLLLGYQYLGLGELDKVFNALNEAAKNPANADATSKLLDIAARMESSQQEAVSNNQS